MKAKLIIVAFCTLLAACSSYWFYKKGQQSVLVSEFKVYQANLTMVGAEDRDPRLREYFKARLYYLGNRVAPDWLPDRSLDFGPCDEELIKGLDRGKDAMMPMTEYEAFLTRIEER